MGEEGGAAQLAGGGGGVDLEPGVEEGLLRDGAERGDRVEEGGDERRGGGGEERGEGELLLHGGELGGRGGPLVGEAAGEHSVHEDAEGPGVDLGADVGEAAEDLGGGVVEGAAVGGEDGGGGDGDGDAPVDEEEGGEGIVGEDDVLELDVAVHELHVVGVVDGGEDLVHVHGHDGLGQRRMLLNVGQ